MVLFFSYEPTCKKQARHLTRPPPRTQPLPTYTLRQRGVTWYYIGCFARDIFGQTCNASTPQRVPLTVLIYIYIYIYIERERDTYIYIYIYIYTHSKSCSRKPAGGKPAGGKPDGGKPDGGKPSGGKPPGADACRHYFQSCPYILRSIPSAVHHMFLPSYELLKSNI